MKTSIAGGPLQLRCSSERPSPSYNSSWRCKLIAGQEAYKYITEFMLKSFQSFDWKLYNRFRKTSYIRIAKQQRLHWDSGTQPFIEIKIISRPLVFWCYLRLSSSDNERPCLLVFHLWQDSIHSKSPKSLLLFSLSKAWLRLVYASDRHMLDCTRCTPFLQLRCHTNSSMGNDDTWNMVASAVQDRTEIMWSVKPSRISSSGFLFLMFFCKNLLKFGI